VLVGDSGVNTDTQAVCGEALFQQHCDAPVAGGIRAARLHCMLK
jgi:hypothetical protein